MPTFKDIIRFIDMRYNAICQRPHMYAQNPVALEAMIFAMEDIRQFAESEKTGHRNCYSDFLVENDFDAACFTSRRLGHSPMTDGEQRVFEELNEFLKRFLVRESRSVSDEELGEYFSANRQ